ncbi:IclR family transcriptional regulator [Lacisediminimonas profundi]|uniref:IclR family transcriptional regulator n=1 Tax=Lacisediminimonas profundi TaxID=2603856 RepID=UPI00124B7D7F|nr:IclR family transcriptional regulator [Lacisediminimonas profundi]
MPSQSADKSAAEQQEAPQSALARGIRILQCFSTEEYDLSAKDLIQRSGLPKPTAFRIIGTLRELGLLHYSERRNKYMLAPGVLKLTAPLLASMTIRSIARPLMQDFADYSEGQVSLAVSTSDYQMVYVETAQGRGNSVFRPEIGTTVSLTRTASGRAFLSLLPPDDFRTVVERIRAGNPERAEWIDAKMQETRQDLENLGYCRNQGELDRNTVGVAVPVRVLIDEQRFIFGCTVPAYRQSQNPKLLEDLGMRLATLVQNVQTALGAPRA